MIQINISKLRYEDRLVLKAISFVIKEREFLALIGHNGSGKSTLCKTLNGLILPDDGDVIVDGTNTKDNSWDIRKKVGIVFQNPEDQLIHSYVDEDIAFGLENLGYPNNLIKKKVNDILKKLNISHLRKQNVNELSYGQKQLVALAGVLVMSPNYIVFDEPTSSLDPKHKSNLLKIIKSLNDEGTSIILVSNNLDDIKKNVKKVIVLKQGSIIYNGIKSGLNKKILKKAEMCE